MEEIIIGTQDRIETCMTMRFHRDDVKYRNVMRQYFVETEEQVKIPFLLNVHVEEELTGMNMGVGTATANDKYRRFKCL